MAERKKRKRDEKIEEVAPEAQKEDFEGFSGGIDIDLDRVMSESNQILRDELETKLAEWIDREVAAQAQHIEDMARWENWGYRGKREEKNFPWPKCANVATPIIRTRTDAVAVRTFDALEGQIKDFICRATEKDFVDFAPGLENGLYWWSRHKVDIWSKLHDPIWQCFRGGTGIVKIPWVTKQRPIVRYATKKEINDKDIKTSKAKGGRFTLKENITEYDGPDLQPIPRERFIIHGNPREIQDAFLVGFYTDVRLETVKVRALQGIYDKERSERLLRPEQPSETDVRKAKASGKDIEVYPPDTFKIWELWFKYDVDEDGVPDDIVVTYHRDTQTILRAIYNPFFGGFRPFASLRFYRPPYQFDGEGIPEMLEAIQEETDTLHNQRLDRMALLNGPNIVVRAGRGLDDFKLAPGMVHVVEEEITGAFQEIIFHDAYPSTFTEEQLLNQYADLQAGSSPQYMGQPTSERPVARETFQLIQQLDKKTQYGVRNFRKDLRNIARIVVDMFAQYQPEMRYKVMSKDENGVEVWEKKTVNFPRQYLWDGINVEVFASSEMLNTEIRREINLTIYQLTSDYYTKLAGMWQAILSPQLPSDFKKFLIEASKIGGVLLERIIRDFNQPDAENLVVKPEEFVDVVKALMQSPDVMGIMQSMAASGQMPPQAVPPQGATQGTPQG